MNIRVLSIEGQAYDMGYAHGSAHKQAIHDFGKERIALSGNKQWSGRDLSKAEVLALAEASIPEHERYSPTLIEELKGMSAATGLSLAELIVTGGFTDFIDTVYGCHPASSGPANAKADNCTAFLLPEQQSLSQSFIGQTWDMHKGATPHVIMLRGKPQNAPGFLVFTTVGCLGMIGMNSEGLAIGINNLSGTDGKIGVTWPFVVRKALMQKRAKDALVCIQEANLAGAHNYLILDKHGQGYNVEAMASRLHIQELEHEAIVHTNHCLHKTTLAVQREREASSQASSEARLNQAAKLLREAPIDEHKLQDLTRDPNAICYKATAPKFVETCGAAIMRPSTGDFWAVWGLPSQNDFEHFKV